jgi:cell division transport system permease protein
MRYSLLINFITVATMTVAMLMLAGYLFILQNINNWIQVSEEQFTIKVYVDDNLSAEQLPNLQQSIAHINNVKNSEFVNKEQAQNEFISKYPDFRSILVGLNRNPFQNMIVIKLQNSDRHATQQTVDNLQKLSGVESIDFGGSWLERYIAIKGGLRIVSYLIGSLILLACVFLISNTIRLNIFTRRDEIEIFKLVGGTKIFIAMPFIIEGLLLGLSAGLLALLTLGTIYRFVILGMQHEMQFLTGSLKLVYLEPSMQLSIVGIACSAGLFGSLFSLRRFLRYHD